MKKLLYIIALIPFLALGQSQDQNYIKTTTYKKASSQVSVDVTNPADAVVQVSYFDGLGRPVQQVAHKQSNSSKDIITHIEYDAFGRQIKEYLPYANGTASLDYSDPTTIASELTSFYGSYNGGTTNPFSEKQLEPSPLGRVLKQAAPGNDWAMNSGKEIKFDYQTNTSADAVKFFTATSSWNGEESNKIYNPVLNNLGVYADNELYKTITKDENHSGTTKNHTTEEFKNKEGQVVLKRTYNNSEAYDTYYVYDQFGNLTYVLPPLTEGASDQSTLDNLGYQYKYDYRNRLVEKKLPGKQWEYIVYDKLDRPVATGPAYHYYGTGAIGWMVTEYDVLGRVTQTGWKQVAVSATDRASFQNSINSGGTPFALSANDILTKNYYDTYTYSGAPNPIPSQIEGQNLATNVKGLPTGSWTKVLDVNNPNAAETSYTLYDEYYRPIRTYTSNHLGGFTQVDSKLDWAGKTEYTITTHKYDTNATALTVRDNFFYTAQDRLDLHTQQINGGSAQLIAKNTYDELGQLTSKNVGGTGTTGLQTVDYTYNIRGWLKGINDVTNLGTDLFAFRINYNTLDNLGDFDTQGTPLYNGNIAATYWKTASDDVLRKYNYNYDELNRLLEANYLKPQNASTPDNYWEKLSYDKNGNIQTLLRNGDLDTDGAQTVNLIDDLVYTYDKNNKNLLKKVMDQSVSPQGFNESLDTNSNGTYDTKDDYDYDGNGNLIKDENKGITVIKYNHLNLPVAISFGSNKIEYIYNAVGQKVVKTVSENSVITKTEYLGGGFQYKGSMLQFFPHAEGYVNVIDNHGVNNYNYVFNYTDHLGNIRVSYGVDPDTQSIKIMEENHYYAFGLKHTNYNSDKLLYQKGTSGGVVLKGETPTVESPYKYKFNQREWQSELGLNVTAMDFRQYDPALGRFNVMDVMTDIMPSLSPYRFAFNNPVLWNDPSGRLEGTDPETDPTIILKEVVVTGKAKNPQPASFNYSLVPNHIWNDPRRPTLEQYNKHNGTSYQSVAEYYNFEHYQPALRKQTQAIHNSTGQVAVVVAVVAATLTGTALVLPVVVAASPAIASYTASALTNPLVQQGALNMTLNAGSQYVANGGVAGDINMIEVASSGVPGTNLIPTVVGETFSLTANKFNEGIKLPNSFSQWSVQVGGGILSNRFGKVTDNHLASEGIGGAIVGEYFKFIVETGSNAAPSLVE